MHHTWLDCPSQLQLLFKTDWAPATHLHILGIQSYTIGLSNITLLSILVLTCAMLTPYTLVLTLGQQSWHSSVCKTDTLSQQLTHCVNN